MNRSYSTDLHQTVLSMAQEKLSHGTEKIAPCDLKKMEVLQALSPLFSQALTLIDDSTNISDEMGIVQAPRLSVLMHNEDYSNQCSATKRKVQDVSHFDGEWENEPQMIRLDDNMNSVRRDSSLLYNSSSYFNGQEHDGGKDEEFTIQGDDDDVQDPELDINEVRFSGAQAMGENATARNSVSQL